MFASYLYTPALRIDSLVDGRQEVAAQALVIDLEDSTHFNAKAEAREKIAGFDFAPLKQRGVPIGMRINTIRSFDGLRDVDMLKTVVERDGDALSFILAPKVRHHSEVGVYRALLDALPARLQLLPFIETTDAVEDADAIARVSDGLCFGQADLVAEMYSPNAAYIDHARAKLCVAAAKYRIPAIDTNSFEIHDMIAFEAQCVAARSYGFTGKAAIHPRQVPVINRLLSMTPEALQKYQSTVDTYLQSPTGFQLLDGQVIAPPFVAKARLMLAVHGNGAR